ncbi:MAG: translation initiation factor IF-2 [Candidatus Diapherotrites archaeon]|uniref:Probable translation initiation factor IF-2 n=1 Tax=Candidatus Iainarchaeum sp. TaxID=3101447 RepID=A0A939C939_9ARCH|nr:translation initiation factor IF-2 [Candidatus Diapherotrites archaeon]
MKTRQPIVTVLGHVDHGKTKLLDKIRGTTVAEKEAGAITQHIGATAMPIDLIKKIAGKLMKQYGFEVSLPGLLFIDTPGHAAFTSLRERGGSIADLAVLVVDITQGFQPQTVEAVNILKEFKTPFIVAANKIDLMHEWSSSGGEFSENLKQQSQKGLAAMDEKIYVLVGKLHQHGFQSERFDRCSDFKKQVPIVPISAKTGEGLPEILMLLTGLSQRFLGERLKIDENEPAKGTVLEVKDEKGLGKTIDVILYSGVLKANDKIVLGGKEKPVETKVRALLMPKPLQEIRMPGSDKFLNVKEVHAAAGVKIAGPNLENALAGSPILVEKTGGELKAIEKEVASIKRQTQAIGPIIKADTLGSLEAMSVLLEKEANLQPKRADVGEVTRKDVMEAVAVKEKDDLKAVVFAFNVKSEESALKEAEMHGIKVLSGNVIYRLIEDYTAWVKEKGDEMKSEKIAALTLPVKVRFMHGFSFRHSKPAIVGVKVLEGKLRPGIRIMNEKGKVIGRVEAAQAQGAAIKQASKGQEIAISVDKGIIGRNLKENRVYYSFIPDRQFPELEELGNYFNIEEKELIEEIKQLEEKAGKEKEAEE